MILDTSALVAIFFGEPEALHYIETIRKADRRVMSVANFVELSILIEGQVGPEAGQQVDAFMRAANVDLAPVTKEHGRLARQAFREFGKGRHSAALNFGDCFAYALAKATGDTLLCKGQGFSHTDIAVGR